MNIKWQKNAHILIKSQSGYLTVDGHENIRRTSFIGRIWFVIKDWYSQGRESQRLNRAMEKTLEAVQVELRQVKEELSTHLPLLPSSHEILQFEEANHSFKKENKVIVYRIYQLINSLILKGTGGFGVFGIPNYDYTSECFKDLPQAIVHHSQASDAIKHHQALQSIHHFFQFDFIIDPIKKQFVLKEIGRRDNEWVGFC
ncbi:hypothetical protein [Candidatus Protochlamydia phocaeensis]|uniref:hypothetical protein n=1 Tax=Candidatus Protochlamydia phocaeensis TaxID=1414722 RepID=UPI000838AB1D|nr:hypothetical protein [Candidatus Protochlamydia phocaeensis]